MRISGGTMLGNCATGSVSTETAPTSTIRMAITMATMGRLMKKRYMRLKYRKSKFEIRKNSESGTLFEFHSSLGFSGRLNAWFACERFRDHGGSFSCRFLRSFHDDAVSRFESLLNNPIGTNALADAHGLEVHFVRSVFVVDDGHLVTALQF